MNVYFVKMTHRDSGKVLMKTGHTKGKILEGRFASDEYKDFDIELIGNIYLTHKSFVRAKTAAMMLEEAIRVVIPAKDPSFMVEEYLGVEPGTMKFSGITEVFAPMSEAHERNVTRAWKMFEKQSNIFQRTLENT